MSKHDTGGPAWPCDSASADGDDGMVDDIKARLEAATDGDWEPFGDGKWQQGVQRQRGMTVAKDVYEKVDQLFIASAPTDIAYLLRLVDELEEELRATYVYHGNSPSDAAELVDITRKRAEGK